MGFSEFERLHRHVSSQLLGVRIDFEEAERDAPAAAGPGRGNGAGSGSGNGGEDAGDEDVGGGDPWGLEAGTRARERWHGGVRKVVALNRFLAAARDREGRRWAAAAAAAARKGCYAVAGRAACSPFEAAFVRASLRMPLLAHGALDRVIVGPMPAAVAQTAATQCVDWALGGAAEGAGFLQRIIAEGVRFLYLAPLDLAFTRKVALGQPLSASLGAFSAASFRGLEGLVAQFLAEKAAGGLVDLAARACGLKTAEGAREDEVSDEGEGDRGAARWLGAAKIGFQFLVSVPFFTVRQHVMVAAPERLLPPAQTLLAAFREVYGGEGGGCAALFSGLGTMTALLPLMFASFVGVQLAVRHALGKSRRERHEEQVESVRECLELRRAVPVEVLDRAHLETTVSLAAKRDRTLMLLVCNSSEHSRAARAATPHFAAALAEDATFLVGQVARLPFLRQLVRDARIPFFLPIVRGTVALDQAIIFSRDDAQGCYARLRDFVKQPPPPSQAGG